MPRTLNAPSVRVDELDVEASDLSAAYDAHASDVFAFCLRRCGDRTEAEDLMSVVFLEAWRCRDRAVFVDNSWRPWLLGIASNVLRNAARSRRRHRAALTRYHRDDAVDDVADEAVRSADLPALRDDLARALRALSSKEREIAELCLVEGVDVRAAAEVLGIPEGTVKSRLARTRDKLRTLLQSGDFTDLTTRNGHQHDEHHLRAPGSTTPMVKL